MQAVVDKTQLRKFGLVLSIGLVAVFGMLIPFIKDAPPPLWPYVIGILLLFPILFAPNLLKSIYHPWMKLGAVLGWVNTRIILGIIFYGIITPMGILMRLLGKDPLHLKFDSTLDSYRTKANVRSAKHMEKPY